MKKVLPLLALLVLTKLGNAQTMPYGQIDTADLKMTKCNFEPDANAEILFEKGVMHSEPGLSMDHHIRVKIFNDFGKKHSNIRLIYRSEFLEGKSLSGLEAETINLEGDKIVTTPLDKKQIYTEKLNKTFSALIFAFPNVKPGSIIEYKFRTGPVPVWFFQNSLPTRYSEIQIVFQNTSVFHFIASAVFAEHVRQPYAVDNRNTTSDTQVRALANIHSLPDEPYMTARKSNLQRIEFSFSSAFASYSWSKIVNELIQAKAFGDDLNVNLTGEEVIFKKSDGLKNDNERIAFIFDTVKSIMKWNNITSFLVRENIEKAWEKKTGNSAEINLIVFHLLHAIGINVSPMVVGTRDYGKIEIDSPNPLTFNNTVTCVRIDSTHYDILDASNKFNLYNTIPYNLLNSYGLSINIANKKYELIQLQNNSPVIQSVFLNAEIKADGKMTGGAEITSDSYNKIDAIKRYKTYGEDKYVDSLHKTDNSIKISSFKMENMMPDSLPLTQKISFNIDLTGSDANYIYFSTNLFTFLEDNPFKNEERFSDIDLGFRNDYSVSGIYKLPQGYKTDALPKSITIVMPDKSIVFKRTVAEENGTILVRYMIDHRQTIYPAEDYQNIRGFYKKMYELLNEQIVLKKI